MPTINFRALEERAERQQEAAAPPDPSSYPRPELKPEDLPGHGSDLAPEGGWQPHTDGTIRADFERQGRFTEDNLDEIHLEVIAGNAELQKAIRGAMDGTLPLDRELEYWEPLTLTSKAIQVVLLTIIGYQQNVVAALTGYSYNRVCTILNHPYARHIMTVALSASVASATNIHRRLQKKAPKMLEVVDEIASSKTTKPSVRLRAAFGWLDRAGYGATKKTDTTVRGTVSGEVRITGERANLLTKAIQEAKGLEVQDADYELEGADVETIQEAPENIGPSGGNGAGPTDITPAPHKGPEPKDKTNEGVPSGTEESS